MRIGLDAREAFRKEPRGIGLYVRHLMRELTSLAPDEILTEIRIPTPPARGRAGTSTSCSSST